MLYVAPLSNLDAKLRAEMRDEIIPSHKTLKRTIIHVTHEKSEALLMSHGIAVFDRGGCRQVGAPSDIYRDLPDAFVSGFVGDSNILMARRDAESIIVADCATLRLDSPLVDGPIMTHGISGTWRKVIC